MSKIPNPKPIYDLEERTFLFSKAVRLFVKTLPKTTANVEDGRQLIKASGSVGANYREANESLSKKDFLMRIKISRKEAKECDYWLRLIHETNICLKFDFCYLKFICNLVLVICDLFTVSDFVLRNLSVIWVLALISSGETILWASRQVGR